MIVIKTKNETIFTTSETNKRLQNETLFFLLSRAPKEQNESFKNVENEKVRKNAEEEEMEIECEIC